MKGRGITPSVVEDILVRGVRTPGRDGATIFTTDQARVIVNPKCKHQDGVRPMISVSIEGNGGSILIEVLGYENAAASNDSDANWLRSRIRVAAGPFSGETDATLTTQDFAYFERELTEVLRTLKGKATFQTDEDGLRFEVEMGSRGTATISGAAKGQRRIAGQSQVLVRNRPIIFGTDEALPG